MQDHEIENILREQTIVTPQTLHEGIMKRIQRTRNWMRMQHIVLAAFIAFFAVATVFSLLTQQTALPDLITTAVFASFQDPTALPDFIRILADQVSLFQLLALVGGFIFLGAGLYWAQEYNFFENIWSFVRRTPERNPL